MCIAAAAPNFHLTCTLFGFLISASHGLLGSRLLRRHGFVLCTPRADLATVLFTFASQLFIRFLCSFFCWFTSQ
jgi:hypothetical protein